MDAILPGLKGMLNLHPLFVHFPIAFWVGAVLFEALAVVRSSDQFHRTALHMLYAGTVAGFAAVGTGLVAVEAVMPMGPEHEVMEIHELLMKICASVSLGLALIAFFAGEKLAGRGRRWFLAGLLVLAGLLAVGSDRGAQMVYQYGVGVDWSTARPEK